MVWEKWPPPSVKAKGKSAFVPGCDPMEKCPYKKGSKKYRFYLPKWLEGWREAEDEYHARLDED